MKQGILSIESRIVLFPWVVPVVGFLLFIRILFDSQTFWFVYYVFVYINTGNLN
jgi:hypothetical protein